MAIKNDDAANAARRAARAGSVTKASAPAKSATSAKTKKGFGPDEISTGVGGALRRAATQRLGASGLPTTPVNAPSGPSFKVGALMTKGVVAMDGPKGFGGQNPVNPGGVNFSISYSLGSSGASSTITTPDASVTSGTGGTKANAGPVSVAMNNDGSGSASAGPAGVSLNDKGGVSVTLFGQEIASYGPEAKEKAEGLKVDVSISAFAKGSSTTSTTSDVDGKQTSTATVTGEVGVKLSASADLKGAAADGSKTFSISSTYTVSVPGQVDIGGMKPAPNPYDPSTMPTGSSIVMDSNQNQGTDFNLSLAAAHAAFGIGQTNSQGYSVGVTKLDDTHVRIAVGPTEGIEQETSVNLGGVGVSTTKSMKDYQLKTVDLDLSTPQGKAAYDQFLATGALPAKAGPGVADPCTVTVLKGDATANFKAGPLGVSTTNATEIRETTHADGSKTDEVSYDRDGLKCTVTTEVDASGKADLASQTMKVRVPGLPKDQAAALIQAFTGKAPDPASLKDPMDVEFAMTGADFQNNKIELTRYLDRKLPGWRNNPGVAPFIQAMVKADNVAQVAEAVTNQGVAGIQQLMTYSLDNHRVWGRIV